MLLYVSAHTSAVPRSVWEPGEFRKIFLEPGESQIAEFAPGRDAISFYDEKLGSMRMESGTYRIAAGASLRDFRMHADISISD